MSESVIFRSGSKTDGQNGGRKRTRKKVLVDQHTMPTPRLVVLVHSWITTGKGLKKPFSAQAKESTFKDVLHSRPTCNNVSSTVAL